MDGALAGLYGHIAACGSTVQLSEIISALICQKIN